MIVDIKSPWYLDISGFIQKWCDTFILNFCYWNKHSVQFSYSVLSDSLQPHGLNHTRLPCPSPTPRACSNSCPLSQWCYPTISSFVIPFSSYLPPFPASVFINESVLHIRWQKYWSFSISPSSEYPGLISFRIVWFDLLAVFLKFFITSWVF